MTVNEPALARLLADRLVRLYELLRQQRDERDPLYEGFSPEWMVAELAEWRVAELEGRISHVESRVIDMVEGLEHVDRHAFKALSHEERVRVAIALARLHA